MIIPDIFGNHISGLDHGIPSKEKSVNGYNSFVGKYSFEWNGKSNKIWNGQANCMSSESSGHVYQIAKNWFA